MEDAGSKCDLVLFLDPEDPKFSGKEKGYLKSYLFSQHPVLESAMY